LNRRGEEVWQRFFEKNPWIFGTGLTFQFSGPIDTSKIEQIVRGSSITGPGKRVDALLRTRAAVSSLCYVEIKRHDTQLLHSTQYRPGTWAPSKELVGGLAQLRATLHEARREIGDALALKDSEGAPRGVEALNFAPRAYLLVGNLDEFSTEHGLNIDKFRNFEEFRRNITGVEIVTYDELFYRAKSLVADP
jgi:hypothetical protein